MKELEAVLNNFKFENLNDEEKKSEFFAKIDA